MLLKPGLTFRSIRHSHTEAFGGEQLAAEHAETQKQDPWDPRLPRQLKSQEPGRALRAESSEQGTQGNSCQAGEQLQLHQHRAGKRLNPPPPCFLEPGILVEKQRKPPALHSPGQRAHLSPELFDQQPDNIGSPRTPSAEEVSSKLQ